MTLEWVKFISSAVCLCIGLAFMILAVFGVNRFKHALNRIHAAAMGDTLGILFVLLGLMIMKGFSAASVKLFLIILFFWVTSPISGHMISRFEAMTNENLGEIEVISKEKEGEEEDEGI